MSKLEKGKVTTEPQRITKDHKRLPQPTVYQQWKTWKKGKFLETYKLLNSTRKKWEI